MKITSITVCKNEAHIIPFFLRHYRTIVDDFIFFDNGSTDGTRELIQDEPNTRIIDFNTIGYQKEEIVTLIRNNAYRELALDSDWFIIVDADEFLWHADMRAYLQECLDQGITLPVTIGFNMFSDKMPCDDGQTQLTDILNSGLRDDAFCKFAAVHKSVDVRYTFGAHRAKPVGNVKYSEQASIKLFHYNAEHIGMNLPLPEYRKRRNKKFAWRTMDIIPRDQSRNTRGIRVWSREEHLKYKAPVFDDELIAYIQKTQESAQGGNADALHQLGMFHYRGHGFPIDYEKAFTYFKKAAEAGNPYAQYHLGFAYAKGSGVEMDEAASLRWYREAAKNGNPDAQNELGGLLFDSEDPDEQKEALECLAAAGKNGSFQAAYDMSRAYQSDKFGLQDAEKASEWRQIAGQGHPLSMFNEGAYQYNQRNFEEAYRWFELAANRGMKQAYELLDMMLESRLGIPKDLDQSIERFQTRITRKVEDYNGLKKQ